MYKKVDTSLNFVEREKEVIFVDELLILIRRPVAFAQSLHSGTVPDKSSLLQRGWRNNSEFSISKIGHYGKNVNACHPAYAKVNRKGPALNPEPGLD